MSEELLKDRSLSILNKALIELLEKLSPDDDDDDDSSSHNTEPKVELNLFNGKCCRSEFLKL